MLKQIIIPEDRFFGTAMRSPQGRKRLERRIRKSRIFCVVGGSAGIGLLALTASTVANEFRHQIMQPNEDFSGAIRTALLFFGLSITVVCLSLIRWHTLATELKFLMAWPTSDLDHPSKTTPTSIDCPNTSPEEVKL